MDSKLQKRKLYDNETQIKKKKKEKGNLIADESKAIKKRKKKDIANSFVNGTNNDGNAQDLNHREALSEPEENVQTKRLKSHEEIDNKDAEDYENEEDTSKEMEVLNGKILRRSLGSTNGLDMLRKFVRISKDNKDRDLAAEFLNAGGNILDVIRLLDSADNKGLGTAATVFSAMRILLIK